MTTVDNPPQKFLTKRYNYGFKPNAKQKAFLDASITCARVVYNDSIRIYEGTNALQKAWYEARGFKNRYDWLTNQGVDAKDVGKTNKEILEKYPNTQFCPHVVNHRTIQPRVTSLAKLITKTSEPYDIPMDNCPNLPAFDIVDCVSESGKKYKKLVYNGKYINLQRSFLKVFTLPEPVDGMTEVKIPSVVLQQSQRIAQGAYDKWAKSETDKDGKRIVGFPRRKRGRDIVSLVFTKTAFNVEYVNDKLLKLKLSNCDEPILIKTKRKLASAPSSVTIMKNPNGKYEASFVQSVPHFEREKTGVHSGVDLGFKDKAIIVHRTLDGSADDEFVIFGNPNSNKNKKQKKKEKLLARLQRQLARMERGSNNYEKQLNRINNLQSRIKKTRKLDNERIANELVNTSDLIALEDLNIAGMAKKAEKSDDPEKQNKRRKRYGKSVGNTGLAQLVNIIKYKAEENDIQVAHVDRFYPSTQTCSHCGAKTGPRGIKNLDKREWACSECGTEHHRDKNASINILVEATRILPEEK